MPPTKPHPLLTLEGRVLGSYVLRLARLEPTAKSGWKAFALAVEGRAGRYEPPVIEGIHSVGGREVRPWVEIVRYRPVVSRGGKRLDLAATGLDLTLFGLLTGLIPPGGHVMLWCEGEAHRSTYLGLLAGVPPAATPLGYLLTAAGFPKIRFFDLPEGGWEGEQKLWAEMPLDDALRSRWRAQTVEQVRGFLAARPPALSESNRALAARTLEALEADAPEHSLS